MFTGSEFSNTGNRATSRPDWKVCLLPKARHVLFSAGRRGGLIRRIRIEQLVVIGVYCRQEGLQDS